MVNVVDIRYNVGHNGLMEESNDPISEGRSERGGGLWYYTMIVVSRSGPCG